jgi:predicted adenine nucleotide alpha hydrolase (AANH) superfamily ATPase
MIKEHDALIIRCPQLGGEVPFRYCRTVNEDLPCRRMMVCWEFRIEISKFLDEHYSLDQIQSTLTPSNKTRLDTILELIEKAKKVKEEGE